jgi:hypothetical protein
MILIDIGLLFVLFGIPLALLFHFARLADKRAAAIADLATQLYQREQLIIRLAHELRNHSNTEGDLALVAEADALFETPPNENQST